MRNSLNCYCYHYLYYKNRTVSVWSLNMHAMGQAQLHHRLRSISGQCGVHRVVTIVVKSVLINAMSHEHCRGTDETAI